MKQFSALHKGELEDLLQLRRHGCRIFPSVTLTSLRWVSFEIAPVGFLLLSSGETALPAASWIGSWLFCLPGLATVTLWRQSRQERTCFWRREGVFCGNGEQLFFYSVLTNPVRFYPVPSNALWAL